MSFDELPPDAQPPRSEQSAGEASDRETSALDAPPATAPRRRRAQRAGTDAASPEAAEPDAPVRRRTPNKKTEGQKTQGKKTEDGGTKEGGVGAGGSENADANDASNGSPEAEARPARRRRAAASGATPDATPTPPPADPKPEADRPRRQTRRKAAPENETASAAPPVVEATTTGEEPAPAKPSRRRSIRASQDAVGAEQTATPTPDTTAAADVNIADTVDTTADASEAALEAASEPAIVETPPLSKEDDLPPDALLNADAEEAPDEDTQVGSASSSLESGDESDGAEQAQDASADELASLPGRRSRQRTSRNRKRAPNAAQTSLPSTPPLRAEADTQPANEGMTSIAGDVTASTEDAEEAEAGADGEGEPRGRRRRNRRNNRSNRGRSDKNGIEEVAAAESDINTPDTDAVSAVIVADLTAEAVVAPAAPVVAEEVAEPIDLNVGAHLIPRNGIPQIHINGKPFAPVLFFGNMEGAKNAQRVVAETRRAANANIHLHSALVELPCPLSEASYVLDEIDARLRALLDADPDGFVMPRLVFVPARGWKREYPTEISAYAEGTTGDPSLTSARFWQECERSLEMLLSHIQSQTYGERVWGYHLERGEWFQSMDGGYDRSTANRDAFRDWLREKYKHSLILLRAAWYEGDVQFHTAEIPAAPGKPNPQRAFYETRRERNVIDFNEFTSESTANRLAALARSVKKVSHNNALVSVCYGYTFEFGHGFSGHLALDRLLASPHVDLITGPPSYRDRKPTGAASFPAPIDSPPLYGKLWLSEDDTKTYLAPAAQDPDDFNPRLADRFATEQAQARSMGRALATNTGVGWMDLWGEGWLDEDGLWERIGAFSDCLTRQQQGANNAKTPDVIALIDEKSLLHIQKGEPFFRKLTNGLRDTLQRSGASVGLYLQSDVLASDFPTDARLYLFLTPYRLTAEQRAAIKTKLQRDNKTLAWLYAPGACEERPTGLSGMEEVAAGVVGITLRPQAWNSEVGSRILDASHPLTERLGTRDLGTRERLNPSFYVDDPGATVLAEYQGSGLPSLAVRNMGNWKSVFVGDPILPLELLRGICRYANVPLYASAGDDIVTVGNGWIVVHGTRDGQRTLRLPTSQALYDMQEQRVVAEETREYRYFLRSGMTRAFCVGTRARFAALDLPNLNAPARSRPEAPGDADRDEARPARTERPERGQRGRGGQEPSSRQSERRPERPFVPQQEEASEIPEITDTAIAVEARRSEDGANRDAGEFEDPLTMPASEGEAPAPATFGAVVPESALDAFRSEAVASESLTMDANAFARTGVSDSPAQEEEEPEPTIEPFPEPRRVAAPATPSRASASLRADLETLKAVLEMEMPDDGQDMDTPGRPVVPPLPLPKEGVPGLDAILSADSVNRRRRRRGGRGRGRAGEENGASDAESADGDTSGNETDAE